MHEKFTKFVSCLATPILIILILLGHSFAGEPIKVAMMDDLQPWVYWEGDTLSGVYTELIRELAQRTNNTIVFNTCPVKRCDMWMREGKADITIGFRETPSRKKYMAFLSTPYRFSSPKLFYIKQNSHVEINQYSDLYLYTIGTQFGSKYFEPFDSDANIHKAPVTLEDQNFHKLIYGRIDALVIPEDRGEFLIAKLGYLKKVKKAKFRYHDESPRYIALSRNSKFMGDIATFNAAMKAIAESGALDRLYKKYYFEKYGVRSDSVRWK